MKEKNIISYILNDQKLKELDQNPVAQARYVYIKLGEHFKYDYNYFTRPIFIKKQIYKRKEKNIKDKVVCTSASRVYAYILSKLGIKAEVIIKPPKEKEAPKEKDTQKEKDAPKSLIQTLRQRSMQRFRERYRHGYVIFEIDGKKYEADLIEDMNRIKVGAKTERFMIPMRTKQPKKEGTDDEEKKLIAEEKERINEEIQKIDETIGYTQNGSYPMEKRMLEIGRKMSIIFDGETNITDEKEKEELERIKSKLGGDEGISEIRKKIGVRDDMIGEVTDQTDQGIIEERLILEINYMIENMGFGDLDFLTKEYYLLASAMKTVAQRKEWAKGIKTEKDKNGDIHEKIKTISCVDRDKKMEVFLVVGLESGNSIIYQLADGQPIQAISREEIAKKFDEGMRTLTNDEEKKSKYMELLTGEEYSKNKESRQGKLFSKNGIFKQILGGNTTISKLNDITRDTKKITEQIRTSEITNEEVGEEK